MASEKTKKAAADRFRNFATLFYPDSCNFNKMKNFLTELHVPAFISPLHDQDINADEMQKKAHWHVMMMFEGKKSLEQIEKMLEGSGAVGVKPINSMRGYARYLCHLDNPEKHEYSTEEVVSLNGADYSFAIGLPSDDDKACREIMDFIDSNNVISFDLLCRFLLDNRPDLWRVIKHSSTLYIKEYLKSRTWRLEKLEKLTGKQFIMEDMLCEYGRAEAANHD